MQHPTHSTHSSQNTYPSQNTPIVLTIAGSDSGGGAGIQADIKTISATGSYACSAITAITSQNTLGVSSVFTVPKHHVASQLDAVFGDIKVDAVKIGMLADTGIIKLVAEKIQQYQPKHLILDPVMVATSGDLLLPANAINTLKDTLLPLADLITPNLPEAAALTGLAIPNSIGAMHNLIAHLQGLNTKAVLLKGGHLEQSSDCVDVLINKHTTQDYSSLRVPTQNTHGTGCTLSAAIASYLAQGQPLVTAIRLAKQYIDQAIAHADALSIGEGNGPVNHFFQFHRADY